MKNYSSFFKNRKVKIFIKGIIAIAIILFLNLRLRSILYTIDSGIPVKERMPYLLIICKHVLMNFLSFSLIKFLLYFIICASFFVTFLIFFKNEQIITRINERKNENCLIDSLIQSKMVIGVIFYLTTIVFFSASLSKIININNKITINIILSAFFIIFIEIMTIICLYKVFIRLVHLEVFELINNSLIDCNYSNDSKGKDYHETNKLLFSIFAVMILFVLCLSVDKAFLVTKLNKDQIEFVKLIFQNDHLFILNKIFFRIGEDEKGMLFSAIIQLSSLFITFVGYIIGFINENIYSINIHMILCWKCSAFKMIYHRMATLLIFVLSFFILNSNYLTSIIFVDLYLIWIIVYNVYLVSSICLHVDLDTVIANQMLKDTEEVKKMLRYVSHKSSMKISKRFSDEYLNYYGKSIFLPMNLLNAHRDVNKEEYYQLAYQCFNKYILLINKESQKFEENINKKYQEVEKEYYEISVCFIIKKWIDDYFLKIQSVNKDEFEFLETRFIYKIIYLINSISNGFIRKVILSYLLFNIIQILDSVKYEEFIKEIALKDEEGIINALIIYYAELYPINKSNKDKIFKNGVTHLLSDFDQLNALFKNYLSTSLSTNVSNSFEKAYSDFSYDIEIILKMKGRIQ